MDRDAWDARYAAAPDLVWTAEPNRFVVQEVVGLPPGRALDLAAGEGSNAVWLAEHGWQVVAVDFSSVAVDRGRQLAAPRGVEVGWIVADVRSHPLPKAAFDLVLVAYLQLAAADLDGVLRRATVALAPGGTMLVVGHDRANLGGGVGGPQDPAVLHPGGDRRRARRAGNPAGRNGEAAGDARWWDRRRAGHAGGRGPALSVSPAISLHAVCIPAPSRPHTGARR